jgi:hypothetical protein
MPNFKPKAKKKIKMNKNTLITLDNKHNEKMTAFNEIESLLIPKLQKKKEELKLQFSKESDIDKKLELKDQILELRKKIKHYKLEKKNYLLENSKYIFQYFENKKGVKDGNTKTKILHSFFKKEKLKKTEEDSDSGKSLNVTKYLLNINDSLLDINNYINDYESCNKCGGELIAVENLGLIVCNSCSAQQKFLIQHEKPSYKEPPKEVCFYAYKRINHFREILAQFQAKETTQIPEEVLNNIKKQIVKERIQLSELTNLKAKDILKKLGYNKYYEHIPFIKDKLGIKPPIMTPQLEEKLCNLFMDIQKPYAKHCPDDRVNFLNYYYVLYKMCELLDERKFLPFFPMLKDPVKRIEQDEIWKKICKELNWEFIPTI